VITTLRLNEWLNTRAPGLKGILRRLIPKTTRDAFADRKFAETIDSGNYDTVFRNIYLHNWWGSPESISGCGSELERTSALRAGLIEWSSRNAITSILDAPCGDFNWMKEVVRDTKVKYIGGDIVPELIDKNNANNQQHGAFIVFDILKDHLPDVEAWVCRDVLFHLPNAQIQAVLDRFAKSDIRFLLTTHFENITAHPNIGFGKYRPVNLCRAPFNWPRPSFLIADGDAKDTDRFLGIWENPNLRPDRRLAERSTQETCFSE
jgi:hypothetical protein